jgi:hypothetical protein
MEETILILIKKEINDQMDNIRSHIIHGGASDYNSYCNSIGSYKAYLHIISELYELEERFLES